MNLKKLLSELDIEKEIREALFEDSGRDSTLEQIKQKKQEKMRKQRQEALKGAKNNAKDELEEEGSPDEDSKQPKLKSESLPDISPEQIADKINTIRAGKSLKDQATMQSLAQYFQRLNGPERIALYAFLQGLSKVLGGKDGGEVKTPDSKPYNVEMDREKKEKKSVTPKRMQSDKQKSSDSNSSSDNPIVVGERADTRSIKARLWK